MNVDDMKNVIEVQKAINNMGYEANSQMEWLEPSQKQSNMVQAVLGGIGAVSLFVAAIGIANTMMMSIYERTKEIGVIKVLGCAMGNIRSMFLIEAGFIGFAVRYVQQAVNDTAVAWICFHRFCHIDWYAGRILPGAQSHETESAGGNQE